MKSPSVLALVGLLVVGCANDRTAPEEPPSDLPSASEIVLASEIDWEQLNPARGDRSPQAGTLWGDRKGEVPTGFLAKFVDGFSSPPHLHNATYRAVVISGLVHNDDPDAAEMWMPPGSFWTQPKGEVHITSSKGMSVALVEIDQGPYLVLPPGEAFDSGERPVNVDPSNIVWVDPPGMPASVDGPKLAYLWGDLQDGRSNGTFVKLPAGFRGTIHSHGTTFRAVTISGRLQYLGGDTKTLEPGSFFGATGEALHRLSADSECVVYIRTDGRYELASRGT